VPAVGIELGFVRSLLSVDSAVSVSRIEVDSPVVVDMPEAVASDVDLWHISVYNRAVQQRAVGSARSPLAVRSCRWTSVHRRSPAPSASPFRVGC